MKVPKLSKAQAVSAGSALQGVADAAPGPRPGPHPRDERSRASARARYTRKDHGSERAHQSRPQRGADDFEVLRLKNSVRTLALIWFAGS
jgi:hypothetical protein